MGWDTKMKICGHGLKIMAWMAPMGSDLSSHDAVEGQLSRQERNTVRQIYLHSAEHLEV